jgi:hypothetical protein
MTNATPAYLADAVVILAGAVSSSSRAARCALVMSACVMLWRMPRRRARGGLIQNATPALTPALQPFSHDVNSAKFKKIRGNQNAAWRSRARCRTQARPAEQTHDRCGQVHAAGRRTRGRAGRAPRCSTRSARETPDSPNDYFAPVLPFLRSPGRKGDRAAARRRTTAGAPIVRVGVFSTGDFWPLPPSGPTEANKSCSPTRAS